MGSKRFSHFTTGLLVIFVALALVVTASASTTKVIFTFAGGADGEYADTDLVVDSAGAIYGTTVRGGLHGGGTVFQLAPSATGWHHTVLYNFTGGADGGEPYKGVTLDSQGNLYGTTVTGGGGVCEGGCGLAFKLTRSGSNWFHSVIHTFSGRNDGSGPGSGLTIDRLGNLYGMTPTGGAFGVGVIYRLRPHPDGTWGLRVLHPFTGGADGGGGSAGRLLLHGGYLFGVATTGGAHGKGVAFRLSHTPDGKWHYLTLYPFKGQPDAGFPYGGLTFDKSGNLYGTTYYDGANNLGCVYELSPNSNGTWIEKVLYSFKGGQDGSRSIANVVFDAAGNLYGTTSEGGAGFGTIFKLAPGANGTWTETVAYRFQGSPDGAFAYNPMVVDSAGNIYGATVHGGPSDDGTIYKFTP